jgi:hypothetical protein
MSSHAALALVLAGGLACAEGRRPATDALPEGPNVRKDSSMTAADLQAAAPLLLDREKLQEILRDEAVVALVQVLRAEFVLAGSRSQSTVLELEARRELLGDGESLASLRFYSAGGKPELEAGRTYLLAIGAAPRARTSGARAWVEVPPGQEEQAVRLNAALLRELGHPPAGK